MSIRTVAALVLVVWIATASHAVQGQPPSAGMPGTPAPEIALPDERGVLVRLTDLKGHVVLIDFWASWCLPCKASFPKLDALYRDLHPRGLDVLAINVDERRGDATAFLQGQPHVMPVLFDPNGHAPEAFAVRGMPTSVVVDRAGIIRFTHVGYTEKTVDLYRNEVERLLGESYP
jgi:thiol-disulfide isomerase/thioredoxin